MTDAIELFLGDIKCALHRFEPKPGDVFVLTIAGELPEEMVTRIQSEWTKRIPYDVKVAVLTNMDVQIDLATKANGR